MVQLRSLCATTRRYANTPLNARYGPKVAAASVMRVSVLLALLVGCGNDVGMEVDANPEPVPVEPRVIAGGGIGDGPIAGVVNLYVIDDVTRRPVSSATVRVGTVDGVTDATGLFVARGIDGPQTIVAKANGYRSEVWVGANGANVTINLGAANTASPASGTITGTITNFAAITVAAGHTKVAVTSYSQADELGAESNEIAQPNNQNLCFGTAACNFTLTSRTGKVAVLAAVFDQDLKGTPADPSDDTQTFLGWAVKTGVTVTQSGTSVALDMIPASMLQDVTVSFGSPPSGLSQVGGLVGIDAGADGTLQLAPMFVTPTGATLRAPKPEAIASGASYRFTGFASNGQTNPTTSVVLRRALTGTSLSAGTWLSAPSGTPTRTGASWTAPTGATVQSLEYNQGATRIVNVTVFDGTSAVTLPDMIAMPSGTLTVQLSAIGAPGLDVGNFSLDADRAKLAMIGGVTVSLN